jgi:hypothetical protein
MALKSAGRVGCLDEKQGNLPPAHPARPGGANAPDLRCARRTPAPPMAGVGLSWRGGRRPLWHQSGRAGETRRVFWSRPEGRKQFLRFNGRGHRPCHSATLASGPAGGQSPRPVPAPPPAGALPPPGRALAFCSSRTCRSTGHRPARAGETRCVSGSRPEWRKQFHRCNGRGYRLCHAATSPAASRGPKPPASARPAPGGRWLLLFLDLPVCGAPFRAGGGNAVRFLCPPGGAFPCIPGCLAFLARDIAFAKAPHCPLPAGGGCGLPPTGRWPLSLPVPPVQSAPARPDPPDQAQGRVFAMVRRR